MAKYVVGHFGGFPLRMSWLPRLAQRYVAPQKVPTNTETIACDLGVGKNMVKAMRAWGRAAGVLDAKGQLTPLAQLIFVSYDPYLERGESIALLHWLIASNSDTFTSPAWLFNYLRSTTFSIDQAVSGFQDYLSDNDAHYAAGTLRGDIEPVLRMYNTRPATAREEDLDDRLFAQLGLLTRNRGDGHTAFTRTWEYERNLVSDKLLLFSLLQTLTKKRTASASLSELYMAAGHAAPGAVFGYSRDGFYAAVEQISRGVHVAITLATMPGEDTLVQLHGDYAISCAQGDMSAANAVFFGARAA